MVYVISYITAFLSLADFKYLIYSQSNFAQQTKRKARREGGGDRKRFDFNFLDIIAVERRKISCLHQIDT